jgi:NAD+ synthase (glutamine-hydrolysing)
VEICEDMWVPVPPSAEAALAGATVLANLSGSPITVARAEDRRLLVRSRERALQRGVRLRRAGRASPRPTCRWDGQTMVYELGELLARPSGSPTGRAARWRRRPRPDPQDRLRQGTFDDNRRTRTRPGGDFRTSRFDARPAAGDIGLRRKVDRFPFVPDDAERLALDCYEAYNIQVSGLEQRLHAIGQPKVVIGSPAGSTRRTR